MAWSTTTPGFSTGVRMAGSRCPLKGHYDDRLPWKERNYRKGSEPCGDPPASFRASPTYVLADPLDNFIAGRGLIKGAIDGDWGKAETWRLGNENSEDALTWNVLRSLQEAKLLSLAGRVLAGADVEAGARPVLLGSAGRDGQGRSVARAPGCP